MVYRSFAALQMGGLTGRNLSALDALGNPLLLVTLALSNFGLGTGVLHPCIMLVAIDLVGQAVLLTRESRLVASSQITVVAFFHPVLFSVQAGFLFLQVLGLTSRELSTLYAIGDAVLLVFL